MLPPVFKRGQRLAASDLNALAAYSADLTSSSRSQFASPDAPPSDTSIPHSLTLPAEFLTPDRLNASTWSDPVNTEGGLFATPAGFLTTDGDYDQYDSPRHPGAMESAVVDAESMASGYAYLCEVIVTDCYGAITDQSLEVHAAPPASVYWQPPTTDRPSGTPGTLYIPVAYIERNELLDESATSDWLPASKYVARNCHPISLPYRAVNSSFDPTCHSLASTILPLVDSTIGRSTPILPLAACGGISLSRLADQLPAGSSLTGAAAGLASFVSPIPEPDGGWTDASPPAPSYAEPSLSTWVTVATLKVRVNLPASDSSGSGSSGSDCGGGCGQSDIPVHLQVYQSVGHNLAFRFSPNILDLTSPPTS